jgi:hypothetical protein
MKFTVAKKDLSSALEVVTPAMANTGDMTAHYLFRKAAEADRMEVLTHSGRIVALCPFIARVEDVSSEEAFQFTIEGWRLRTWLESKPDSALMFSFDPVTKQVSAEASGQSSHSAAIFDSLDPANWICWDKTYKEAKEVSLISAARLHHALGHAKSFASVQESQAPEICVCVIQDGIMKSTDKVSATFLKVQGLENSTLKVHVRDVAGLLSFLALLKEEDVGIMEHPRMMFFRRQDGAVYGESRFTAAFPSFKCPPETDAYSWTFDVDALRKGTKHLFASAKKDDVRVRFQRPDLDGPVIMSMPVADKPVLTSVKLDVVEGESSADAPALPAEGFQVSCPRMLDIINLQKADTIRLGVNLRVDNGEVLGGYLRFRDIRFSDKDGNGGDEYITVLVFLENT